VLETYSILAISGISGLLLGINPKIRYFFSHNFHVVRSVASSRIESVQAPRITFDSTNFTDQEIDFLIYLINSKSSPILLKTHDLDDIIFPMGAKDQRSRIIRNNFLRNLNLKLLMIYGIKEAITRLGSEEDKRKKCYYLHDSIFRMGISEDIQRSLNQ
jgi:hypothetical protein